MFYYLLICVLIACTSRTNGIITIHHDKPEDSTISKMASKMKYYPEEIFNVTISPSEREKRLLPYENFYQSHPVNQPHVEHLHEPTVQNQRYQFDRPPPRKTYLQYSDLSYNQNQPEQNDLYQSNNKFTPFLESNAIPGPFRPMIANSPPRKFKVQYVALPSPQQTKTVDYSAIYDQLSQLKRQHSRRPTYRPAEPYRYFSKPQINYIPERNRYKTIQPTKTFIETFTATNIDIPTAEGDQYSPPEMLEQVHETPTKNYENERPYFQENTKPYVNPHIAIEIPQSSYPHYEPVFIQKVYQSPKQVIRKPYILVPGPPPTPQEPAVRKPIVLIQRKPIYKVKPVYENVHDFDYVTESPKYDSVTTRYQPHYTTSKYDEYQTVLPVTVTSIQPQTENPNGLSQILKHLQATNTLPQTLTPDNIDNSIKTLVKILEALKKQQKFSKPIVVPDESSEHGGSSENETEGLVGQVPEIPGTITQSYPADTPDGGTPGKPGVDYPALSSIPQTSFNCKMQRYKGFFGDPDTHCQVWHYCDLNGGQASFLCPNGTIFSQVALTCDWWYNVKCSSTAQLYVLNERLYKYIIPLSPKFPEDYSGPLVDKYLALKFQEMEEKMRKEKKAKGNTNKEEENEGLQNIESESVSKAPEVSEHTTLNIHQKETLETIENDNDKK